MPTEIFHQLLLPVHCHMVVLELGKDIGGIPPQATQPMPAVRSSPSGVAVLTRCQDFGDVELVVWIGDPDPAPAGWSIVFDGDLETTSRGFDVGTGGASLVHIDAPPGKYRVRAESRLDANGEVDGVRFIFPDHPDLVAKRLW